ncbi:MAG: CAF17-like 4Fe-4S cluster assembly/insertion protein YgfZ [Methylomonas sp.]
MDKQPDSRPKIFPLSHFGVIAVTGDDRAKFLQGQLTCDINSLSESRASLTAFCNPKGRVISTLLVAKTAEAFLLILPASLLDKVLTKLKMYVLRSAVQLSDQNETLTLLGIHGPLAEITGLDLPSENFAVAGNFPLIIRLPGVLPRYLYIADSSESASALAQRHEISIGGVEEWHYQDISSGLPWFEAGQSEQYIPQMLNIDGLGGISFNKGCYTGQEIIARTHYLGKAKRNLFLAECEFTMPIPEPGLAVLDKDTKQSVGALLRAKSFSPNTRLLVVLQAEDAESKQLILDDAKQTAIKIVRIP